MRRLLQGVKVPLQEMATWMDVPESSSRNRQERKLKVSGHCLRGPAMQVKSLFCWCADLLLWP